MYEDDIFLNRYEDLIKEHVIEVILDESEIFLMYLNYKYITQNKEEKLHNRTSKLAEAYQRYGYSNSKLQCSSICSCFSKIDMKIINLIKLYSKTGLISICKLGELSKDDFQNQDTVIKFIINHNIIIEENATLFKTIENKKRQMIIFGDNIPFMPIEEIGLSTRYLNALDRFGIKTIADVCERINDYKYFKDIRGFTENGFEELVNRIHQSGFLFVNEANHMFDDPESRYKCR